MVRRLFLSLLTFKGNRFHLTKMAISIPKIMSTACFRMGNVGEAFKIYQELRDSQVVFTADEYTAYIYGKNSSFINFVLPIKVPSWYTCSVDYMPVTELTQN